MDENDVCPLCIEELDISDRQFFPCKCGYQVCMWCWHRIRESESGLCPACRTPYGDDPHEFSAVDMEEVVKANKEKAAAEKRERERLRQQAAAASSQSASAVSSASSVGSGGSFPEESPVFPNAGGKPLDPPKDRNQLANMRVIRRNLVYAVGLPPSIATEETLRKAEYFGQNGKISKIVLNRNHNGNGDPRRASASAYVTFLHKEDTLACILALDGFYLDGRNIRASYGTSKYCSAFIKNVRCNNPDCTYLHCMGDAEDTFTKQEIQAGYVTSGRDVLAQQQQQLAVAQSLSSNGGSMTRRRVGGGGPSGSGRAPSTPVFPPPCFDEPAKPHHITANTSTLSRSSSLTAPSTGFSTIASAGNAKTRPAVAEKLSRQQEQLRRMHPQTVVKLNGSTTAAAVVASGNSNVVVDSSPPPPHTTLTPLTPIRRATSLPVNKVKKENVAEQIQQQPMAQNEAMQAKAQRAPPSPGNVPMLVGSPLPQAGTIGSKAPGGFIGGSILMGPGNPTQSFGGCLPGLDTAGGWNLGSLSNTTNSSLLGGLAGGKLLYPNDVAPTRDKWNPHDENSPGGSYSGNLFGNSGFGGPGIWGNSAPGLFDTPQPPPPRPGAPTPIGAPTHNPFGSAANSGSNALASMLGIDLPTGTGSLRENFRQDNSLWGNSQPTSAFTPVPQPPVSMAPARQQQQQQQQSAAPIAPPSNSDIALLQSLLPGVHITSGNAHQPAAPGPLPERGWGGHNPPSREQDSWGNGGNQNNNGSLFGNSSGMAQQHPNSIW